MNTNQAAIQNVQVEAPKEEFFLELSEAEIQLVAGGTAITNSI